MAKEIKKIEIVGPPGRIFVKEPDLQRYLSKGYKRIDSTTESAVNKQWFDSAGSDSQIDGDE